jgi:parvulin-like peptidyl-prolyl isomerase
MSRSYVTHAGCSIVNSITPIMTLAIIVASSVHGTLLADEPPPIVFEADQVLAKVDSEDILAGDVVLGAMADFNRVKVKIPLRDREASYFKAIKSQIASLVKVKLLYLDARKNTPEVEFSELIERIERDFDAGALDDFLDSTDCANCQELEAKLKPIGSSIERVKRNFVESQLAEKWFRDRVNERDLEVTRDETLERYEENLSKYEYLAKARYEELVMKPSDRRNERQVQAALAQMGDSVKKGAAWADVAKARSEGTTAAQGGQHSWISQGSHRSTVIDEALFSLAVGEMSPILKDDRGFFNIIRVIEREPAGVIPFEEVENDLAQEIKQERAVQKQVAYMKKLFADAHIWSSFDKPNKRNAGNAPLGPPTKLR